MRVADSNEIYKSTVYNFFQIGDPAEIEMMNFIRLRIQAPIMMIFMPT